MIDRASTFADPDIIKMLQQDFVPVAFDQWYLRRQDDAEGRFYQRIAKQGPRNDMKSTTQGFYIATGDGELLHYNNNRGPKRIKALMQQTLARKRDWMAKPIDAGPGDPDFAQDKPEGTLVVQVNTKVLGGYKANATSKRRFAAIMQSAIGRDNLWIYAAEKEMLLKGQFPDSLAQKIARFHAVDNTRGEPPMWKESDVKVLDVRLEDDGVIRGQIELATEDNNRFYHADIFGHLETSESSVTRFDLVIKGDYHGHGRFTPGAPKDAFPFAVAMRLADDSDVATSVLPQPLKAFGRGYLFFGSK